MKILLIDDEPMVSKSIGNFLSSQLGHDVTIFTDAEKALSEFKSNNYEMVLSDIRMPGLSGLDLLKEMDAENISTDIVLMTGHASINSVIEALRSGAYDFLEKPVNISLLAEIVKRVEEHQQLLKQNKVLTTRFDSKLKEECGVYQDRIKNLQHAYSEAVGIGKIGMFSNKMQRVVDLARRLHKDREIPVLIQGETGTGKEVIARIIHYGEEATTTPFVSLNCSAISPSLFESELFGYEAGAFTGASAKGKIGKLEAAITGSVFFDEIGEMPLDLQPKLLKALQDKEIYRLSGIRKIPLDIRTIFATNRDLINEINSNRFREDLFYRINTVSIEIPPLRERKEEILPLAQLFLREFALSHKLGMKKISTEAAEILHSYHWPGNIRELKNAMDRVSFMAESDEITSLDLSFLDNSLSTDLLKKSRKLNIHFNQEEMDLYKLNYDICTFALKINNGNKTKTAKYLNISLNKLKRILKEM